MRIKYLILFLMLASTNVLARPISDAEYTQLVARFQAKLDAMRIAQKIPGATAAFVLPDGRMGKVASGYADVENKILMTPDTRMLGGSTGKTYVAVMANKLAEQGIWSLDDKLSKYLGAKPWFKRLPNRDAITIRMLLRHRSGIDNYYNNPRFFDWLGAKTKADPKFKLSQSDIIEFVLDRDPLFKPDYGFHYTDVGYILVGLSMEKATGRSHYDLVQQELLNPVGLTLTTPQVSPKVAGLAQGYSKEINPLLMGPKMVGRDGMMTYDPSVEYTGGGLVTNSGDLARWAAALYGGKVVQPSTLMAILERPANQAGDGEKRPGYYGMGVGVRDSTPRLSPVYGHDGYIPGYQTSMHYYPKLTIAVTFQINTEDGIWEEGQPGHVDIDAIQLALANVVADAVEDKPIATKHKRKK
jgi:D-alanyl-D-alanine carboxypeptidase